MVVSVANAQRTLPVHPRAMSTLARCAMQQLGITGRGTFTITFLDARRMRAVNKRFLRHDRLTDVLSFRYEGEPVVGEVLISPAAAHRYATAHGIPYREELARYVVHGLLHWLGHEDRTAAQQRHMRTMENQLLLRCQGRQERRGVRSDTTRARHHGRR